MRPADAHAKILDAVKHLDPVLFAAKTREYSRFGLPGSSFSDGRGGEPSLPLIGRTDRQIVVARAHYQHCLDTAAVALEAARRLEMAWCLPLDTDSVKEKKLAEAGPKGSGVCGNIWCDHLCEGKTENDRLRKAPKQPGDDPQKAPIARCQACDQYWRRHGVERDPRRNQVVTDAKAV